MKRPISLTIVGAAWLLIGLVGLLDQAWEDHVLQIPSSAVLTSLAGIGLLSGWRMARWYAFTVSGLACLFLTIGLPFIWGAVPQGDMHSAVPLPAVFGWLGGFLVFSGATVWTLFQSDVDHYFASRQFARIA